MKKNFWWLMVVIVFVAGLLVSNMLVQAKENVTEVQWEYKTVITKFKKSGNVRIKKDLSMLNEHGKDGWELCAVSRVTLYITYYFKREIKE